MLLAVESWFAFPVGEVFFFFFFFQMSMESFESFLSSWCYIILWACVSWRVFLFTQLSTWLALSSVHTFLYFKNIFFSYFVDYLCSLIFSYFLFFFLSNLLLGGCWAFWIYLPFHSYFLSLSLYLMILKFSSTFCRLSILFFILRIIVLFSKNLFLNCFIFLVDYFCFMNVTLLKSLWGLTKNVKLLLLLPSLLPLGSVALCVHLDLSLLYRRLLNSVRECLSSFILG